MRIGMRKNMKDEDRSQDGDAGKDKVLNKNEDALQHKAKWDLNPFTIDRILCRPKIWSQPNTGSA